MIKKLDNKETSYEVVEKHLSFIKDINEDSKSSGMSIRVNKSFQDLLWEFFDSERSYQEALLRNERSPRGKREVVLNAHDKSVAYVRAMNNYVQRVSAFDEDNNLFTLADTIGVDIIGRVYDKFSERLKYFLYPSSERFSYGTVKYLEKSGVKDFQKSGEMGVRGE